MKFKPEIINTLKNYNKETFVKDLMAGIIVGIIAIPLSIALSIASGASPKEGLMTAAIAGFVAALLGGSRVQVTGPTGAFVVIVYGVIAEYGYSGLVASTILAGIMLIVMGLLGFGKLIKFIPRPIVSGFTSGIAIVILSGQIKDILGLKMGAVPSEFIEKCIAYAANIGTINIMAVVIAVLALAIMVFTPKINKNIPGSLVAIIVTTVIVQLLNINIDTIGSNYPDLTGSIPRPSLPNIPLTSYMQLIRPAFTIALLGAIESLLSAVVSDKMIGAKHDSDTELIAQGASNIASGLFGGLPATGAIARTAANVKNGGRTPIAGIVHAFVVLAVSLIFLPYAKLIPMSTLGAVLVIVCYNMFDFQEFKEIKNVPKSDTILMITTFVLTVVFDLIVAIEIGLIMAAILFIKRISEETSINKQNDNIPESLDNSVHIYSFTGPLFFGNIQLLDIVLEEIDKDTQAIVLNMDSVTSIDSSVIAGIKVLAEVTEQNCIHLYMVQMQSQPAKALKKAEMHENYKTYHVYDKIEKALLDLSSVSI